MPQRDVSAAIFAPSVSYLKPNMASGAAIDLLQLLRMHGRRPSYKQSPAFVISIISSVLARSDTRLD